MLVAMNDMRDQIQTFVRRFGLLNTACREECCGQQVSMVQSHILGEVRRLIAPSMQRVADELAIDITTFSRQASRLQEKGLLERVGSPDDRRVTLLTLTDEGEAVLRRIDAYMDDRLGRAFAGMSAFEQETVLRSLELLNNAIGRTDTRESIACRN